MAKMVLSGDWQGVRYRFKQFTGQVVDDVKNNLDDFAGRGTEDIRRDIETTPSGIVDGKPNRIWTGNMHDKVDSAVTVDTDKVYEVLYGWPDLTQEEREYIKLQEYGGEYVAFGMHSLWRSLVRNTEILKGRLRRNA